ncbi:MAG: M60 family metallopeptidase [Alistipes sp.]|nr:M60 family metallopeptidase [Alistipes sp.]
MNLKTTTACALGALLCTLPGLSAAKSPVLFADNFDKRKAYDKNWEADTPGDAGVVRYSADGGVGGSGCVEISSDTRSSTTVRHRLTGLTPGALYRFSASVKCENVEQGRGAVLFLRPDGLEQPWNASEFAYGTSDWKRVYMDFVPDVDGTATVCCGLGFPWGTVNGGKALGRAWFDDVEVRKVADAGEGIYTRESRHIVLRFDRDKVTISDEAVDAWLAKLDRIYDAYRDLVGDVPYGGRKITILTTPGIEPGYWALAGNPILWNNHVAVREVIERTESHDDWGFGIMHEIGHVFSAGNIRHYGSWNWNDEIFANFRMSYALEACDGVMSQRNRLYRGAEVRDYYKIFYDETIGAGKAVNNGDALHYTFLRIKDRYGWDVYKKAFRALYEIDDEHLPVLKTAYDKMLYFLSFVSEAAGEDVTVTCYAPGELELIRESLCR